MVTRAEYSEYEGGGVMPNGIFPQDATTTLSASDELMLMSTTGQTVDTNAPVDPYFWNGNVRPPIIVPTRKPAMTPMATRYKESPPQY